MMLMMTMMMVMDIEGAIENGNGRLQMKMEETREVGERIGGERRKGKNGEGKGRRKYMEVLGTPLILL